MITVLTVFRFGSGRLQLTKDNPRFQPWVVKKDKNKQTVLFICRRRNGFGGLQMSHSFTKIWIHGVFGTKDRQPIITAKHETDLYDHIKMNLINDFGCFVKSINGTSDHIHILFLINPNHSCSDIFKNIKGESSHWWNQQKFSSTKFTWQTGYGAFSVSESMVNEVNDYIMNQKQHHQKITYAQEVEQFITKYGLELLHR